MEDQSHSLFSQKGRLFALGLLFLVSFAVRIYHINIPLLDFHPMRQYRAAIKARDIYFDSSESIPEWRKEISRLNSAFIHDREPLIMEHLAFISYCIVGEEKLWIPRIYSILFWLIGGIFIYIIIRTMTSADAALLSTALYLLFPFGILASRSFQPDPLMIMGMVIGLYLIVRYYKKPSLPRLLIAAIISALAIIIKFVSFFVIIGAFVALGLYTHGFRKFFFNPHKILFIIISVLPPAIYYLYGFFAMKDIYSLARGDIIPSLLLKPLFWKGWLTQIGIVIGLGRTPGAGRVIGYMLFFLAVTGIFLIRDKLSRALIYGMWTGYIVFGMIFSYTAYSHDYWHLQLLPIIAISLSPVILMILNQLNRIIELRFARSVVLSFLFLILILGSYQIHTKWKRDNPGFQKKLMIAKQIGKEISHSSRTLFLSADYGLWLKYHGEIVGISWPSHWDLKAKKLRGKRIVNAEERFASQNEVYSSEFFIVTFLKEFESQKDLKDFLYKNFPVYIQNRDYLIFDLRERIEE